MKFHSKIDASQLYVDKRDEQSRFYGALSPANELNGAFEAVASLTQENHYECVRWVCLRKPKAFEWKKDE